LLGVSDVRGNREERELPGRVEIRGRGGTDLDRGEQDGAAGTVVSGEQ